jgi:hypothetical protein
MNFFYPLMAVGIKRKYKNTPANAGVEEHLELTTIL